MSKIGIADLKAHLSEHLRRVQSGRTLTILDRSRPIAQIIPPPPPKRPESWLGSLSKTGKIIGDIVSPAVPEHEWEASRR